MIDNTLTNPRTLRRAVETTLNNSGIAYKNMLCISDTLTVTAIGWKSSLDDEFCAILSNLLQTTVSTSSVRDGTTDNFTLVASYNPDAIEYKRI